MPKTMQKDQKFSVTLVNKTSCPASSVLNCLNKHCPDLKHPIEVKSIPNQPFKFKLTIGSIADLAQIVSCNASNFDFVDDLHAEPSSSAELGQDSYINMLHDGPMYKV